MHICLYMYFEAITPQNTYPSQRLIQPKNRSNKKMAVIKNVSLIRIFIYFLKFFLLRTLLILNENIEMMIS